MTERETTYQPFHSQDLISNSPYCRSTIIMMVDRRIWYWIT